MILIGLSGKRGTGKSITAKLLQRYYNGSVIVSFGNPIKDETAKFFGFDKALCYTQEGKERIVKIPVQHVTLYGATEARVRELIQWYGTDYKRQENPDYWLWCMDHILAELLQAGCPVVIIDDVRMRNEANLILGWTYGQLFRLDPYPGWQPDAKADHETETALDDFDRFTDRYAPGLGELDQVAACIAAMVGVR